MDLATAYRSDLRVLIFANFRKKLYLRKFCDHFFS